MLHLLLLNKRIVNTIISNNNINLECIMNEKEQEHLALDDEFTMNIEEDLNNLNFFIRFKFRI